MNVSDNLVADLTVQSNSLSLRLANQVEEFFEWAPPGVIVHETDPDTQQVVRKLETQPSGNPGLKETRNRYATAAKTLQFKSRTQQIIENVEDLLALNRRIKEAHLFGGLRTLGTSKAEAETEVHAKAVAEGLSKLMELGSGEDRMDTK